MVPLAMCGSYSSISSIVHLCFSRSASVANRWTFCFARSPYGIGCRTAATLSPIFLRMSATRRVVWLLPEPVRTAHTATTGFVLLIIVLVALSTLKSAPAALTSEQRSMT